MTEALPSIPADVAAMVERMAGECAVAQRVDSESWKRINEAEVKMAQLPQQLCPLLHVFTPGLYTRQILMPAGTLLTSRIHLFEHPYIISAGVVSVWDLETGWQTFRAPHIGVTKPGTRRVLYIHEDCIWTTSHLNPDNETDPQKIVERVTYDHMQLGHMDGISDEHMAAIKLNQRGQLR